MVTSNKTTTQKEFLQNINIRTMAKDLKQLREADALREREKISRMKTPKDAEKNIQRTNEASEIIDNKIEPEKPLYKSSLLDTTKQVLQNNALEEILQQKTEKEHDAEKKIRDYGSESEKQQIFLLESQKLKLKNLIDKNNKETDPSLALEKNKILLEQKDLQSKLADIIKEEEKNEALQKLIEDKKNTSNTSTEKQNLEKNTWTLEEKKQELEKRRWVIEGDLMKLENRIKNLNEGYKQSQSSEDSIKKEIVKIDDALRIIYSDIAQREKTKRELLVNAPVEKSNPLAKNEARGPRLSTTPPMISSSRQRPDHVFTKHKEKEYLKDAPEAAIEKLKQSTEKEEKQRTKFMADVDSWIATSDSNKDE